MAEAVCNSTVLLVLTYSVRVGELGSTGVNSGALGLSPVFDSVTFDEAVASLLVSSWVGNPVQILV